ncbi:MAG: hypothetical protein ACK5PS_13190 [Desulfopila sp.]
MTADMPNCRNCRHFFITYQPMQPYGCRAMGFVCRRLPSQVVHESSGLPCQLYETRSRSGNPGGRRNPGTV